MGTRINHELLNGLCDEAYQLVAAVEDHRAAGRRLVEALEALDRELNIAVPDVGDLRFDSDAYGNALTSLMVAAGGLEHGVAVPFTLRGATKPHEWVESDSDFDKRHHAALQPSEV